MTLSFGKLNPKNIKKIKKATIDNQMVGTWIWITGDTKPVKDKIKQAGCTWHSKRGCWYFKIGKYYGRSSPDSLEELAKKYGCTNASKFNKNIKVS